MKKFLLAAVLFCSSLFMTGCVNSVYQEKLVSVEKIEKHLVKNETTLNDLRELLGTPAIIGRTKDDNKKVAGFIIRSSLTANLAKNVAKHVISLGFMLKTDPYVQKNAVFKFDENDVMTDYSFDGYSYIHKYKVKQWIEDERALTQEELYSVIDYDDEEILTKYKESLAKEQGCSVRELSKADIKKRFPYCNLACHCERSIKKAFGEFDFIEEDPEAKEGDGSKLDLINK